MDIKHSSTVQGTPVPGARGHEKRDFSVGWIFGIVLFLLCSGVMIHVLMAALLEQFNSGASPTDAWRPLRNQARSRSGPGPQLQISPRLDLHYFRAQEDKQLTNYAWVDRSAGVVRVPIERAMELVLERGLPVGSNGAAAGRSPQELIRDRLPEQKPGTQNQP
jgi:hypothetical protein